MSNVLKFDIRKIQPVLIGNDLKIGSYRIKNIREKELNVVVNKEGIPVGLVIAPIGSNYSDKQNRQDINNWINGNFTNTFFDECINKEQI